MSIEFRERSVSSILFNLNAFWSSSLMQDRHVIDQTWRGYLNTFDNLYTQLYQLHYAKSINTITPQWLSHWERFEFNKNNQVETFNSLYPHAYTLPKNVKSVYLLRESPREISMVPALTVVLNTGAIMLPDGSVRFPGDLIYTTDDWLKFKIPCVACAETGQIDDEECPICLGHGKAQGATSEGGFGVETVKYYKRADDVADYDENVYPLGDFVVDESKKIIAFKTEPYEILYSEYVVRDTEIIYDNFGTLIRFYKQDSYNYLRQLQGLWYTYWHGSTIRNLRIGLNVVTDLPFVTDMGFVENISFLKNSFLTSFNIPIDTDADNMPTVLGKIMLPAYPAELTNDSGKHDLILVNRGKTNFAFTEGLDYLIFHEYEDAHDYDHWSTFDSFNNINSVPSQHKISYLKLLDTAAVRNISPGDILDFYFRDGSGSYVVTISGRDYIIPDDYAPEIVVNQHMQQFEPLTNAINVYDYINYPKWWENLMGYGGRDSFYYDNGRVRFDSAVSWDNKVHLDSYRKYAAKLETMYHHTFLVSLEGAAVPRTFDQAQIIVSFLETIKPSYTHYIIRCLIDFYDNITTREAHFAIKGMLNFESIQGPIQRLDEAWTRKRYDRHKFDSKHYNEKLLIAKLPLDGLDFISYLNIHSCTFDSLEKRKFDSNRKLDSRRRASELTIFKQAG